MYVYDPAFQRGERDCRCKISGITNGSFSCRRCRSTLWPLRILLLRGIYALSPRYGPDSLLWAPELAAQVSASSILVGYPAFTPYRKQKRKGNKKFSPMTGQTHLGHIGSSGSAFVNNK